MIDKFISILQFILPVTLLIKTIIIPYINKLISIKSDTQFKNEAEVKRFIHKKKNETNELHTLTFFLYGLLIVWFNWPKILSIIEYYVSDLGNIGNYIGAIIEIGFLIVLQLHIYKYAMAQKMNVGESIKRISIYKDNNEKLVRNIYIFSISEVFLQSSIIGLIPFFQVDRFFYVDIIVILVSILVLISVLWDQILINSYNRQHRYLRSWTIFIISTIFANSSNALLDLFGDFLNLPPDNISIIIFLLLRTIWIMSSFIQLSCLLLNLIQKNSMEEWYND